MLYRDYNADHVLPSFLKQRKKSGYTKKGKIKNAGQIYTMSDSHSDLGNIKYPKAASILCISC